MLTKKTIKNLKVKKFVSTIDSLIKEQVDKLFEADPEPSLDLDTSTDSESSETSDSTDDSSGDGLDLGGDESSDLDSGTEDGSGDELESDSDLSLDSGSSGGLGGGLSGGGGGGSFDFGDDSSSSDDSSDSASTEQNSDSMSPNTGDPIVDTVSLAKELLNTTSDQNRILAALKAKIQTSFNDWSEAEQIVYDLWDTEDPTLKIVASKLLMFIDQK